MVPAGLRRWLGPGRTGVKICGITREEDALAAVEAGVDALGFNFYPGSKRAVRLSGIAAWVANLPADIGRVAVLVQPGEDLLRELRDSGLFHAFQFHGGEPAELCRAWGGGFYVKACPLSDAASADAALSDPAPCLLLDAHAPGVFGGTGRVVDWSLAARVVAESGRPVVLSGGLNPDNAGEAVRAVRPAAIDAASGVESSPGRKDPGKMRELVAAVRAVQGTA
jgi:phosphoribosylanthranilate isomerase